jgi:hypothetical protein
MTPYQHRLYRHMLTHFHRFNTGGTAWAGVRGGVVGTGSPTFTALASRTIRWMENNRVAERSSLPNIPIYTAGWWGLAAIDVDIQAGDIYTNGVRAFTITGVPDTSQGFQVIPAATLPLIEVPSMPVRTAAAGYQIGLRIGAF